MAVGSITEMTHGLYIGGGSTPASDGGTRESISPSTGQPWAVVAEATTTDVDRAVATARAAVAGPWGEMTPRGRAACLRRLGDLIEANRERLVEIEARDNGKTVRELAGQYGVIPEWYRYFAGLCDKLEGATLPAEQPGMFAFTLIEPIGVVGAITPWNSPGLQLAFKAAPALAAGNALVLKPSEQTPIATLETAPLFAEAGIPDGVFNVVCGGGAVGAALAGHRDVDLVVFTGSDATGRKVGAAAGGALSDVILELGGKSPQLVFEDADLDVAAAGVAAGFCMASGQTCVAGTRIYVQRSIATEFTRRLIAKMAELRLGDPLDPETEIGPVSFSAQLERIASYVELAREEGATILTGGRRVSEDELAQGYYFEPTLLGDVSSGMRVMREEIFGPVAGVQVFDEEPEAVALANDSRLGLAAGVWTTSLSRAHRLARRLDAGTVWINSYRMASPASQLRGFKDSGVGFENGQDALQQFTRRKLVWMDYSGGTAAADR